MFNLCRHLRLMGFIVVLVNLFFPSPWLLLGGVALFAWSYQISTGKIETILEEMIKIKEEKLKGYDEGYQEGFKEKGDE